MQIDPGWPRQELEEAGISFTKFCYAWGKSKGYLDKLMADGSWPEVYLESARVTLMRLKKQQLAAQPKNVAEREVATSWRPVEPPKTGEPAVSQNTAEPVGIKPGEPA